MARTKKIEVQEVVETPVVKVKDELKDLKNQVSNQNKTIGEILISNGFTPTKSLLTPAEKDSQILTVAQLILALSKTNEDEAARLIEDIGRLGASKIASQLIYAMRIALAKES